MQPQAFSACPNCGQADAVQPITEVFTGVATGDAAVQAAAGAAPLAITAEIRQQLAPPAVPVLPQKSDFPASKYRQTSPETSRSFGSRLDLALLFSWLVLTFIAYLLVSRIDEDLVEFLGTAIAIVLIVIIVGFRQLVLKKLPILGLREYYIRDAQEDAEAEQRAQAAYQVALAAYEQSRSSEAKWRELRYCARCNGVVTPQGAFVPLAGLPTYLGSVPGPAIPPSPVGQTAGLTSEHSGA